MASEKILKVWETLNEKNLSYSNNWIKFHIFLKILNFKMDIRNILSKLFPMKFKYINENSKISEFNLDEIKERVNRLQSILKIKKKLKYKLLSKRTILIK